MTTPDGPDPRPVYPPFDRLGIHDRVAHLRFTHYIEAASIRRPDLLVELHERDHRAGFDAHTHRQP